VDLEAKLQNLLEEKEELEEEIDIIRAIIQDKSKPT
jgi:CHASE3 domain sensor protein